VAVVVVVAPSNKLSELLPLIPDARKVLNTIALREASESCVGDRGIITSMHPSVVRLSTSVI